MKVGVISDIHSNVVAFTECMKFLEEKECDEYLFLGDYISDTPYTRETMDMLYDVIKKHKCTLLRGNREEYMLAQRELIRRGETRGRWIKNSASGNLLYAYERLTERDMDFFESLPISFVYAPEGYPPVTCCHGSPDNARELLQHNEEPLKKWLGAIDTPYLLCAHTHYPGETVWGEKHYFNSGCAGVPIGTPGTAQCMIMEGSEEQWIPAFYLVQYDCRKVAADCIKFGLMDYGTWFINSNIQILLTGEDNAARMVMKAGELQKEAEDSSEWPYIDEKYFEEAAKILGIPDYRNSDLKENV